ncbi:hypothetical protein STSP2_00610 [Anaerohalosphaera lusitana]|uniref:Uncharacterized protein n=1 Tax=Anaerohalosphaera lusitana TaxID=1936003 RepID=A0A1U9NHR4_9BACT|nr:hypothetical protein [Anaerohalosphaera lusitana]AQT67463.1 hypothetical protein STSP2_00610 [Anaerohalosphaera lusitana]
MNHLLSFIDFDALVIIGPAAGITVYEFLRLRHRKKHGITAEQELAKIKKFPTWQIFWTIVTALLTLSLMMYWLVKTTDFPAYLAFIIVASVTLIDLALFAFLKKWCENQIKKNQQQDQNNETEQNPPAA